MISNEHKRKNKGEGSERLATKRETKRSVNEKKLNTSIEATNQSPPR